jgi:ABC-type nitrate/sulfonate/bicarbonate transport system substrate-binding protein
MSTQAAIAVRQAVYTICPVLVASHVAVEKGWLDEEFQKINAEAEFLRSRPPHEWLTHFTHTSNTLFRDGGNIPAIWAKSQGQKTRLLGLTFSGEGGVILVRTDSPVRRFTDLKHKRFGLPQRIHDDRVDFWRATAERGIRTTLELHGIEDDEVSIIDLPFTDPELKVSSPIKKPADVYSQKLFSSFDQVGFHALLSGRVDAIYSGSGRARDLEQSGKVRIVEDLSNYPDWYLQIANSPYTITVSAELADAHPDIVVAYLRAAVRAGKWINQHPAEAATIFATTTHYRPDNRLPALLARFDFVPSLSGLHLAALGQEKKFLLENGYLQNDFELNQWVDAHFLDQAVQEAERM